MDAKFQIPQNRLFWIRLIPVGIAALVILGVLLTTVRVDSIQPNEVGVLINNFTGNISVRTQSGSFFYNGLTTDVHKIDKTVKTLVMRERDGEALQIKTRDGSNVTLDVEINYAIVPTEKSVKEKLIVESGVGQVPIRSSSRDRRGRVRRTVSGYEERYQSKWIREYSRAVIRYVFGELSTKDFYNASMRDAKTRKAKDELDKILRKHGLQVIKVVPDKFSFYPEYEVKIREKKDADQEYDNQLEQAKTQLQIQEKEKVQAEKAADVKIEETRGKLAQKQIKAEAEAIQVQKDSEAYAIKTRIEADAGFYQAERQAKGILAAAKSEAEGLTNLANALEGDGGRNLVLRALAERLKLAQIDGLPYATSGLIQKVSVEDAAATGKTKTTHSTNRRAGK